MPTSQAPHPRSPPTPTSADLGPAPAVPPKPPPSAPQLPPKPAAAPSALTATLGRAVIDEFVPRPGLLALLGDPAWAKGKGVKRKARSEGEGEGGEEGEGDEDEDEEGGEAGDEEGAVVHADLTSARRVAVPTPSAPTTVLRAAAALLPAPIPSKRAKRRRGARAGLLPAERLPPMPLPPLPPILDPALAARVFTHPSHLEGTRAARAPFEAPDDAGHYEKLEHVGDAVLGMVVTCWLHEIRPGFPCGTATKLKSHLVSNGTLSHLSGLYGLPARMRADARLAPVLRAQTDVRAALFEAYVAAVLFSYPAESRFSTGLAVVSGWLREMYDPLFDFFYAHMAAEAAAHAAAVALAPDGVVLAAADPAELDRVDALAEGMALLVGTWARSRARSASYAVARAETGAGALWSVTCLVDGVEMGSATRAVKNRARNAAAWEAAVKLGLTADTTF
ncbi:hypothetical protein Q8F55_007646 [Vanrija albida]|uniref:RNase III domain-containing protein n=1 Tax=Vanrija albida TaxID=181172 RepID=A0ABR3PU50_9TREE